jgi:hypothetical protein
MFMFQHQAARKSRAKVAHKYSRNVANSKCLGAAVTNRNCVYKKIKNGLNSVSAYDHAVQNCLQSRLQSRLLYLHLLFCTGAKLGFLN